MFYDELIEVKLPVNKNILHSDSFNELFEPCLRRLIRKSWHAEKIEDMIENNELDFGDDIPCDYYGDCWCKRNPDRAQKEIEYIYHYKALNITVCEHALYNDEIRGLIDVKNLPLSTNIESYINNIEKQVFNSIVKICPLILLDD